MAITTVLAYVVARRMWRWSRPKALRALRRFLLVDLAFFGANVVKIVDGGWFPLAFGLGVFVMMSTWKRGRELLFETHPGRFDPDRRLREERIDRLHDHPRHRGVHNVEPRCGPRMRCCTA